MSTLISAVAMMPVKKLLIFSDAEHLNEAINDLLASGFDGAELGLLAGEFMVKQALGDIYTRTNEFADSPNAPATAFVRNEMISDTVHGLAGGLFFAGTTVGMGAAVASAAVLGGALLPAVVGVAAVTTIGAVIARIIHESDAQYLKEQVDEGHLLLFVRTLDSAREEQAAEILSRHSGFDVRIHEVPAVSPEAE